MDLGQLFAHYNNIIILTTALNRIKAASVSDSSVASLRALAEQALRQWDEERAKPGNVPPGLKVVVEMPAPDDPACPRCGGTWPTACSCPAGTLYFIRHEPTPYKPAVRLYMGASQPAYYFAEGNLPAAPHRQIKLPSGHVACIDCLKGGQYVDGPTNTVLLTNI